MALIGGVLLAAGVALFILEPVFSGRSAAAFHGDDDFDEAAARRLVALTALRDLEYDRATGKLDGDDYEALKLELSREALVHLVGFALLIGFVFFISYFDITRVISGEQLIP